MMVNLRSLGGNMLLVRGYNRVAMERRAVFWVLDGSMELERMK
jgi:hypothetical protein